MVRLTPTQRIILKAAADNERGLVKFTAGDRQGTRVVGRSDGIPVITAYSYPEWFLVQRGFLEHHEGYIYKITPAGSNAVLRI